MIGAIVTLIVFAALAWMVFNTVNKYLKTEGAFWDRILAGAKDSATIMWSYVIYAAGVMIARAGDLANMLNMPEVANVIYTALPPQYVGYGMMAIAVVTIIARLRSL